MSIYMVCWFVCFLYLIEDLTNTTHPIKFGDWVFIFAISIIGAIGWPAVLACWMHEIKNK